KHADSGRLVFPTHFPTPAGGMIARDGAEYHFVFDGEVRSAIRELAPSGFANLLTSAWISVIRRCRRSIWFARKRTSIRALAMSRAHKRKFCDLTELMLEYHWHSPQVADAAPALESPCGLARSPSLCSCYPPRLWPASRRRSRPSLRRRWCS